MPIDSAASLAPPPRPAHLRRGVRNLRRAYRTIFGLLVLVLGSWAGMDAFRWEELSDNARWLDAAFGIVAVLALVVWRQVERPLGRELRLARFGVAVKARIVSVAKPRGRRGIVTITYAFRTTTGGTIEAQSKLPRRFPVQTLEPGMEIEVLHDLANPHISKPRPALTFVEFTPIGDLPRTPRVS
ncbi:MAG TPA: hypothetical protein VFE62_12340 [Gemmataceae bacterium]|nr:hypothetical protein [Gemmataceae bacterium]